MFKENVGKLDRGARTVLGLALFAGFFLNTDSSLGWLYLVGGIIAMITATAGSCAVYSVLGVSACNSR